MKRPERLFDGDPDRGATGLFSPKTYITRAEAAAIVSRMAKSGSRVHFTLK